MRVLERAPRNSVRVDIFGQQYLVASDEEQEDVMAAARLLDERMREVAQTTTSAGTLNIAILAGLNLAGDYLKAREKGAAIKRQMEDRSRQLVGLIEDNLKK